MTFATSVARLDAELKRLGLDLQDMRAERHLELSLVGVPDVDVESTMSAERSVILAREPVAAPIREIPRSPAPSKLEYFLDGTQRTLPSYFSTAVPIIASINAAAVLRRDDRGNCQIMPRMLALRHAWLVPLQTNDPTVDRFVEAVRRLARQQRRPIGILDPLDHLADGRYQTALDDFAGMVQLAYERARKLRQRVEEDLLGVWSRQTAEQHDRGWIVVDGALRHAHPRTIGLVKSFTRQYLTGDEAAVLFRLPRGHRTAAFRVQDKWREGVPVTAWYLRMHDATGRDPRHALVRIETGVDVEDSWLIDELSAWLLAERIPRATADQRWATLLYPVHYLERILKSYLEAETRGWPSPR